MLSVSVNDFGPIARGLVDLKPLTIFMGRSNTGKSYMATAIHALMTPYDAGSGLNRRVIGPFRPYGRAYLLTTSSWDLREEFPEVLQAFLEWMKAQDAMALDTVSDLPVEVRNALKQSIIQFLESYSDNVIQRLRQIYGEPSEFTRRGEGTQDSSLTIRGNERKLHLDIQLVGDHEAFSDFEISQLPIPSGLHEYMSGFEDSPAEYDEESLSEAFFFSVASLIDNIFVGLPLRSFYLPAARSGIAQGHKVLAASLVSQSRRIGIEPVDIPTLPGITTEFLSHIVGLDKRLRRRPRRSDFEDAIRFIEDEVLRGGIDLESSGGLPYPEIVYKPGNGELPAGTFTLDHTSSMVSELAPLILFLKYVVGDQDLLILEEPESHLHPGAQRQMARGIARLVNAGLKVIITTHSDMFVAQINNLLRLSHASERWVREHSFQPEDCLRQDQVGAFLFHYDEGMGGSTIDALEVDPETGIEVGEFLNEIELVYDEAIALQRIRVE